MLLTPGARFLLDSCIRTLMVSAVLLSACLVGVSKVTDLEDGTREPPSCQPHHPLFALVNEDLAFEQESSYQSGL